MTLIPKKLTDAVIKRRAELKAGVPQRLKEKKELALREVERLIAEFRAVDPNLGRIVLFGSLGEDKIRSEHFDIDLSFEGVEYYRCVDIALKSSFKVDLVDYRACASHIREEIDTKGRVVYDPGT